MRSPTTSIRAPAKPPRTLAWTRSARSNIVVLHQRLLDEVAELVTEEEVRLLDAGRVRARHDDRSLGHVRDLAAVTTGDAHGEGPALACRLEAAHHVGARARGGEPDRDVVRTAERVELAGEDVVERAVVRDRGEERAVGGERHRREAGPVD